VILGLGGNGKGRRMDVKLTSLDVSLFEPRSALGTTSTTSLETEPNTIGLSREKRR